MWDYSVVVEWIGWRWVNTISTSTRPGSKHKRQATATLPVWKYERSMHFTGVQAQATSHWRCGSTNARCVLPKTHYSVVTLSFWQLQNCYDSVKVAWKGGKSSPAPNCRNFLPQRNYNPPTKVALRLAIYQLWPRVLLWYLRSTPNPHLGFLQKLHNLVVSIFTCNTQRCLAILHVQRRAR